jgi:uncharacterized protein (DUF427 family)
VEPERRRVRIDHAGELIAESDRAVRVLETASPPTIYIPFADTRMDLLRETPVPRTHCEWKGVARYFDLELGDNRVEAAAWHYPDPRRAYDGLRDHVAFYAGRVDACHLDNERVRPQGGAFYGGWITDEIEGPYKGEPGTEGW